MTKRQPTIMDVIIGRVGIRRSIRVLGFLLAWSQTMVDEEAARRGEAVLRNITLADYQAAWDVSESTKWRDLGLFREAFPSQRDPNDVCRYMAEVGASKLGLVRAPSWLVAS